MVKINKLLKSFLTLKGFLKIMFVIFIMNMTNVGRDLLKTIQIYIKRGFSGMGKF